MLWTSVQQTMGLVLELEGVPASVSIARLHAFGFAFAGMSEGRGWLLSVYAAGLNADPSQ